MFVNSGHFTRFDHSIVIIEFNGLKITTSLEHVKAILRDYYGKDKNWRQEDLSLFPSDWHENGNGEDTGPSVAEFLALGIAGLDLRFHIQKQEDSEGVRRGWIRPLADDQEVELHQLQDPTFRRRRKADFWGHQISDGRSGNRIRKKAEKTRMRTSFRKAEKGAVKKLKISEVNPSNWTN